MRSNRRKKNFVKLTMKCECSAKLKQSMCVLEAQLSLPEYVSKRSGRWLTSHLSFAIEHLPDKEELVSRVFKQCVIILFLSRRSKSFRDRIIFTLASQQKSKWTIFLDKLSTSSDRNMLTMYLLKTLVQELISKERDLQPFWTPAYEEISEKLLLPTETGYVGSDSNSLNHWSTKQEEKSPSLTIRTTELVNKSLQTISYPSYMFSPADKWEKGVIPTEKLKTVIIKLLPSPRQRQLLNEFLNTSRYVYNRTVEYINNGHKINFQSLRDILVTESTKKTYDDYQSRDEEIKQLYKTRAACCDDTEKQVYADLIKIKNKERRDHMKGPAFVPIKNSLIESFELNTPKDIRSNAVNRACDAFKSGFTNLRRGNIKFFNMKFKKKTEMTQTIELSSKNISIKDGKVTILPTIFKADRVLKVSRRNQKKCKNLQINNNVDIVKHNGGYYLHVTVPTGVIADDKIAAKPVVAGVDPGIRTYATVHSNSCSSTTITEYVHRRETLRKLNKKLDLLKKKRNKCRKKQFQKIERKKINFVNALQWDFINHLLKNNDVIYFGDIKSHGIVKDGKNKVLNRDFNDLKFYQLKQRLKYKASLAHKRLFFTPEPYTTKTCSGCGTINNYVGAKEIFSCPSCNMHTGRDFNAAKNIKMKGMLS